MLLKIDDKRYLSLIEVSDAILDDRCLDNSQIEIAIIENKIIQSISICNFSELVDALNRVKV